MAWLLLAGAVAAVAYLGWLAVVERDPEALIIAAFAAAPPVAAGVGILRSYIEASPDGLTVQNPMKRYDIGWCDIVEVEPGYYGLEIATRDAQVVHAYAVQKSNYADWLGTKTRADQLAEHLLALSEAYCDPGSD